MARKTKKPQANQPKKSHSDLQKRFNRPTAENTPLKKDEKRKPSEGVGYKLIQAFVMALGSGVGKSIYEHFPEIWQWICDQLLSGATF